MSSKVKKNTFYGITAEFSDTDAILAAAEKIRDAGYTHTDGYSSIPVHGLTDALGIKRSKLAAIVLGVRISKSQQTSNWSADVFTPKQIKYAATDAWVCLWMLLRFL